MKSLLLGLIVSASLVVPALAQQPDPEAMQRMAQEMEKVQKCLASVDQQKLQALQTRAEAVSAEIERLCAADDKDAALKKGLAFAQEMRANPEVKKVRECTKGMSEMMKGMPMPPMPGMKERPDPTENDICS